MKRSGAPGRTDVERMVAVLLGYLGEDAAREGLQQTPRRVVRSLEEMTSGYAMDAAEILSVTFEQEYDEMVVVAPIEFWSLCEHHMLPFHGTAHVGYIPNGRVVGLSKIPRLVHCFARRLQIQERLTKQIAESIRDHLGATGVAVVVNATHLCMAARGVRSSSTMTTSSMLGSMREHSARAEFLALARR